MKPQTLRTHPRTIPAAEARAQLLTVVFVIVTAHLAIVALIVGVAGK